ncbi:MAG: NAD(P)H-hydrate dehydratase [Gemmatimonadales bacterium]
MTKGVRVSTASETVACERATIEMGTTSAELMKRAGEGAAENIATAFPDVSATRVAVFAGSGNNGGDGWIVAGRLAATGYDVRVIETGAPRSDESREAKATATKAGARIADDARDARVIVDALLGTGSSGAPRDAVAIAVDEINRCRLDGAYVFSLDLPSGLDATTGQHEKSVIADTSISFGTIKRGHLISRDACGEIVVLEIGLAESPEMKSLPLLIDADWVKHRVPSIPATAHKGSRKRLAIVGGGKGMAGAVTLSGEGALRSGIGLLRIVAFRDSALPVHASIPAAIFQEWPVTADELSKLVAAADAFAIGPGLGVSPETRDLVERILLASKASSVLDADGLNLFAGDTDSLAVLLAGRRAVITPHPAEMGRLLEMSTEDVLRDRFEIGAELSRKLEAAVLLKGTPSIVFAPSGERYVSAAGTAALATGGSGDVLTGIVGTLIAQMPSSAEAAACAAFIHGRAAELCGIVRGTTLDDILHALPAAWNERVRDMPPNVIARLRNYQ